MIARRIPPPRAALALALLALSSACADARIRELEVGMKKDSVFKILGRGAPETDSLPNVYRRVQYFVDSKSFDILLFDSENREVYSDPLVGDADLTPVILVADTLAGIGWDAADELTDKYAIRLRTDLRKK